MGKAYDKRLDDTIRFIRQDAQLTRNAAYRGDAADLCDRWLARAPKALQVQISELMSQGRTSDGETMRAYRRAVRLLGTAASSFQWNNFAVLSDATLEKVRVLAAGDRAVRGADFAAQLDDAVEIALGSAGDAGFMNAKLHEFKSTPLKFLEKNRLKIAGGAGGRKTYYFSQYLDGGSITYALQASQRTDCLFNGPVQVINVPASSFGDTKGKKNGLKGLANIIGTEVAADGQCVVMTTTQFTGCSFCIQKCGPNLVAAHMDPEGVVKNSGLTGPGIRAELLLGFGFDTANLSQKTEGKPIVYGCKENGDDSWGYEQANRKYMTIVGLFGDNGWTLFTQFNAVDGSFTARQIYPKL